MRKIFLLEARQFSRTCAYFVLAIQNVDLNGSPEDECTVYSIAIRDNRDHNSTTIGFLTLAEAEANAIERHASPSYTGAYHYGLRLALDRIDEAKKGGAS